MHIRGTSSDHVGDHIVLDSVPNRPNYDHIGKKCVMIILDDHFGVLIILTTRMVANMSKNSPI